MTSSVPVVAGGRGAGSDPDALCVAVAAGLAVLRAGRLVLVLTLALVLTVAGYRPGPAAPAPAATAAAAPAAPAAPVARDWAGRPLDALTVAELRQQARAAGHRALARNGRRADLLAALAAA